MVEAGYGQGRTGGLADRDGDAVTAVPAEA
jgi:hypothetical protein